jgi:gluconolactonase
MLIIPAAVILLAALSADNPAAPYPGAAGILPPGALLETLWDEGTFTEGPAWVPGNDGPLLFSDIGNRILQYRPESGLVGVYREPSGRANGLAFTAEGLLVACEGAREGGGRRVSVTGRDGVVRTLADSFDGKRLNSPNDLAVAASGHVFFSDPRYGGDEGRALDFEGVFRIDPDGSVHRLETTAKKPNGLALAPDGKTLYVADNGPTRAALIAVPLGPGGVLAGKPRVIKDFGKGRGIDGMTVTVDGQIVAAASGGRLGGVYVYQPDGTPIAFLKTPATPTNVEFGGAGRNILFITAGKGLYRIATLLRGMDAPPRLP